MLIDARTLLTRETIVTEVCIVGTGPAGMTLAHELIGQDFRVCLLESGGFEPDKETQSLCSGETVGDPYSELDILRRRQFGGTTNDWCVQIGSGQTGVRHVPLDQIDFEKRDWLPYSFAEEIARAGLGQLQIELDGETPQLLSPSTHHHMGTTRIHTDPKQGVVDENCQVHGVSNLFIAGSSVFPTSGYANPTLTIVALAVRLADQVKRFMALRSVTVF